MIKKLKKVKVQFGSSVPCEQNENNCVVLSQRFEELALS